MKKWVKQEVNFLDIRAIYTDIITDQRIQETRLGQFLVYNTNNRCDKPTDIFVPQEFEGWDFYTGGNIYNEIYNEDATEDEDPIYSYGHYCCDGDGFVSVLLLVDGTIQLLDQGDYMLDLSPNLDEAMKQATEYLKEQYFGIYEMWLAPLHG
jgi:hypothetical protein